MESVENFEKTLERWVKKVLENRNFEKIKIEFPDYDTKGGYAGEVAFVDAIVEKNGKKEKIELIIKKNRDGDAALDTLDLRLIYEIEVELYSILLPYFEKFAKEKNTEKFNNIPYCYGTIEEKDRYVIIMENLKTKGYKVHNIKVPMNLNHVKLVLEAYAEWHALSFALKDQKRTEIFKNFQEKAKIIGKTGVWKYYPPTVKNELNCISDMYKKKNNQKMVAKMNTLNENFLDFFNEVLIPTNDDYLVVRHGDCWNNNFLFHYNSDEETPDKVVVIDWQLGVWGPPLADVTQLIFNGCSRKELEHLDELLLFYYDNLSRKIRELGSDPEKCFPWDVCAETFKKYAPMAICGNPLVAKMSYKVETDDTYDITEALETGNYNKIMGELENPEGFYERVNGVLEFCIERKLI